LKFFFYFYFIKLKIWGLGIGDWGLGIGDWGFGFWANNQKPIPQNQNPKNNFIFLNK